MKELEIKVRGNKNLSVMKGNSITQALIMCEEYHFIIFNIKEMNEEQIKKYKRIMKILDEETIKENEDNE